MINFDFLGEWASMAKLAMYITIATMILSFLGAVYHHVDKSAVNRTELRMHQEHAKELAAIVSKQKLEVADAVKKRDSWRDKAGKLAKQLIKTPKVKARDIINATKEPDCNKLCPAVYGLWIDITQKPDGFDYLNSESD